MMRVACVFVLAAFLIGCGDSSEDSNVLRLQVVAETLFFDSAEEMVAVLHAADGRSIEREIDLRETNGIADFGAVDRDTATVSVLNRGAGGFVEVTTFADLPVANYASAPRDVCANAVPVNLSVDLSGATGGSAGSAGVTGFAGQTVVQGSSQASSSIEFRDLEACPGAAGRFFATAIVNGRPDAWVLENVPNLQTGGDYAVAVNQASQSVPVAAMNPMPDHIAMVTLIDGYFSGASDSIEAPLMGDPLFGPLNAPGAAVALVAVHEIDERNTELLHVEIQPANLEEARVTAWQAEASLGQFDSQRSSQAFSFTSSVAMQLANMYYYLPSESDDSTLVWTIYADAQAGQISLPVLPQPEEGRLQREDLESGPESLTLLRYGAASSYGTAVSKILSPRRSIIPGDDVYWVTVSTQPESSPEPEPTDPPTPSEPPSDGGFCIPILDLCLPGGP